MQHTLAFSVPDPELRQSTLKHPRYKQALQALPSVLVVLIFAPVSILPYCVSFAVCLCGSVEPSP